MFIDSHCHLFYEDFRDDIDDVIARAKKSGVIGFVVPATNYQTTIEAIALAEKYDTVFVCAGFHPLDLEHFSEEKLNSIEQILFHPKIVAVGEIGIDYFYDTHPHDIQQKVFIRQIDLAVKKNLPIVVHTRDSVQDAIDIVVSFSQQNPEWKKNQKKGVFHCFTGDANQAKLLFENNFLVSYPGPVTFKKSSMPEVIKEIGISNVMLETDSPFLAPVPHRGKRNEPSYIPIIAQKIAEIANVTVEELATVTSLNTKNLFNLTL